MHSENDQSALVSTRVMEIVVALLTLSISVLVIYDSNRLGFGWGDVGPQSGYFPFYVGLILGASSLAIIFKALGKAASEVFVERGQAKLVMSVFVPCIVFAIAIWLIGIYVASAIFIAAFMAWQGKFSWVKCVTVGVPVSVALFFMFEVWFQVPLPKGPLEHMLGY